jgi:hypothetical protein
MNRRLAYFVFLLLAALALPAIAAACPTCKDQLAHDPASAGLVRGYAYSILFMLSMPPLIFGSLCAYFYWEVRRARTQAQRASEGAPLAASHS